MKQLVITVIGTFINGISLFSPRTASKLALLLFSKPRKIKIKDTENDFLMTAFTEVIDCKDLHIMTYRWLGKKETILLAHGWESNAYRWKSLIQKLNALDYNIVALDAPAHGKSSGTKFNALLYSECIHRVAKKFDANIIIGHSVGGMATAFCMGMHTLPAVNKLVLLGAPSNFVGVFHRYMSMMGYNKRVSQAMDNLVLERFKNKPEYFSAARFMDHISIEGLLIHDIKDKIIPYSDVEDFKNYYKTARLISTEGLGHGLRHDNVNNHIIDFVNA